jgi:hypothetical protein
MLWAENVKSLRHRYPMDCDTHRAFDAQVSGYSFTEYVGVKPGPIGCLADFYDFQACEHPTWRDSDAFFAVAELRLQLVRRLPGAEAAPWGVVDECDIASFAEPTLADPSAGFRAAEAARAAGPLQKIISRSALGAQPLGLRTEGIACPSPTLLVWIGLSTEASTREISTSATVARRAPTRFVHWQARAAATR